MKQQIWDILEPDKNGNKLSKFADLFIVTLIILNVIAITVETNDTVCRSCGHYLRAFDIMSVGIFTIEYFLRVWSCTASEKYAKPFKGRMKFIFSPMALIDLFAILPFYLPFMGVDLRSLRVMRLLRLFRVLKLNRYLKAAEEIRDVFSSKKQELAVAVMLMAAMLYISATVMYFAESSVQPDKFPDILSSLWWATSTLTTVGYGDVYPVTTTGKFIASLVTILGIGLLAIPTGILGAGFIEAFQKNRARHRKITVVCPHCNKEHEADISGKH